MLTTTVNYERTPDGLAFGDRDVARAYSAFELPPAILDRLVMQTQPVHAMRRSSVKLLIAWQSERGVCAETTWVQWKETAEETTRAWSLAIATPAGITLGRDA